MIKDQTGSPPSESYLHFQLEKGLSEYDAFQKAQLMMARYFEKLKRYETAYNSLLSKHPKELKNEGNLIFAPGSLFRTDFSKLKVMKPEDVPKIEDDFTDIFRRN